MEEADRMVPNGYLSGLLDHGNSSTLARFVAEMLESQVAYGNGTMKNVHKKKEVEEL